MGNPNTLEGKVEKMTLSDYYQGIPTLITPKKEFIEKICKRCEVNENTARNWVFNRVRPQKASHYRILSEITGIPAENLFPND